MRDGDVSYPCPSRAIWLRQLLWRLRGKKRADTPDIPLATAVPRVRQYPDYTLAELRAFLAISSGRADADPAQLAAVRAEIKARVAEQI